MWRTLLFYKANIFFWKVIIRDDDQLVCIIGCTCNFLLHIAYVFTTTAWTPDCAWLPGDPGSYGQDAWLWMTPQVTCSQLLKYFLFDEQLITNYGPISVLNFFSKIFEKVVANYIVDFLESNNILYEHQYGFRKGHSTNHAVITLVERVAKALDTGKIVVGVYLDIRKAFDAIDHPILLRKLYSLGIRGNLYTWIKSYLTNRSQFVMYNNSKSETKYITHGVPQVSILGPLFFIVFMNDFSRASNILFSILFADDTTVIIEGQNCNNLILTLNTELNKLSYILILFCIYSCFSIIFTWMITYIIT